MLHYDSIKAQNANNVEKEESEKELTDREFMTAYNHALPVSFPKATLALLEEFRDTHEKFFKHQQAWTMVRHRKAVMDWLSQRTIHTED